MDDDGRRSSGHQGSFEERLRRARRSIEDRDLQGSNRASAYSFGFRLATDLIAGVLGGFGIGWLLDYWLGTSPWLLLLFTPLGMAAGIMNVIRAARSAQGRRHLEQTSGEGLPSVADEED